MPLHLNYALHNEINNMKQFLVSLILCLLSGVTFSQQIEAQFSPTQKLRAKKQGTVTSFVGVTSKYVYTINNAVGSRPKSKFQSLVAFDKNTMKEAHRIPLMGDGTARARDLKKGTYQGTYFSDDKVMITYKIPTNRGEYEIKAEVFDAELKKIRKLTTIFESSTIKKKNNDSDLIGFTIKQNKETEDLAMILEIANGQYKNLSFSCIKFDFNLEQFYSATTDIPVIQTTKRTPYGLTGTYFYPNDGFIYGKHAVLEDNEETKRFWKSGKYKIVVNRFDPENETFDQFDIMNDKYSLTDISLVSKGSETRIVGFFRDPTKASSFSTSHGIFSVSFNQRTKDVEDFTFSPFTTAQLDEIFHRQEISKRKQRKQERKASRRTGLDVKSDGKEEGVFGDLVIDDLYFDDKGNVIVITSLMHNYTVETCTTTNGITTCRTNYYCRRTDINTLSIDKYGQIEFASHIERSITYSGWYRFDVSATQKDDHIFIFYGNNLISKEDRKSQKKKFKNSAQSEFEYAKLDLKSGELKKDKIDIQQISKRKRDRRQFNPNLVGVFDGEVYSYRCNSVVNPIKAVPVAASSIFIFPLFVVGLNQQLLFDYYGTMMKIEVK